MLFKWIFFSNLNFSFSKWRAKIAKECYYETCILVVSQKIDKFKIKRNNPLFVHPLEFFDTKHMCMIIIYVSSTKSYNHVSHALAYFMQILKLYE
jgi:hypothetical protein